MHQERRQATAAKGDKWERLQVVTTRSSCDPTQVGHSAEKLKFVKGMFN